LNAASLLLHVHEIGPVFRYDDSGCESKNLTAMMHYLSSGNPIAARRAMRVDRARLRFILLFAMRTASNCRGK
jgi:hypothetical protein